MYHLEVSYHTMTTCFIKLMVFQLFILQGYCASIEFPCRKGQYCQYGIEMPCPEGTYSSEEGLFSEKQCKPCDRGHYCRGTGLLYPMECSKGHMIKETGATSCMKCPSGTYCDTFGLTAPSGLCKAGYFCTPGSISASNVQCPSGSYCPKGSSFPLICPKGTYSGLPTASECNDCTPGYYCSTDGLRLPTAICPLGYYCNDGTVDPIPCPRGTYSNETGATSCMKCPSGTYCDTFGLTAPSGLCKAGYYCTPGSISASNEQCLPGSYCPKGSSFPLICPKGTYSGLPTASECNDCTPGYYCSTDGLRLPTAICPVGHYCDDGTIDPTPCPSGTYSNATGISQIKDCVICPPGYFCHNIGQIEPSGMCHQGYYCNNGSTTIMQNICKSGSYCPVGSHKPIPCPSGTYGDAFGLVKATSCKICPAGNYCHEGSSKPTPCNDGSYCPKGSKSPSIPCPKGTYLNTTRLSDKIQCITCPSGYTCASVVLNKPVRICPKGFFCPRGNAVPVRCKVGTFCNEGSSEPTLCPSGTYGKFAGNIATCETCPFGYYCNQPGRGRKECPFDKYCPPGSIKPRPCKDSGHSLYETAGRKICGVNI